MTVGGGQFITPACLLCTGAMNSWINLKIQPMKIWVKS